MFAGDGEPAHGPRFRGTSNITIRSLRRSMNLFSIFHIVTFRGLPKSLVLQGICANSQLLIRALKAAFCDKFRWVFGVFVIFL